jgi:hypothetical protein
MVFSHTRGCCDAYTHPCSSRRTRCAISVIPASLSLRQTNVTRIARERNAGFLAGSVAPDFAATLADPRKLQWSRPYAFNRKISRRNSEIIKSTRLIHSGYRCVSCCWRNDRLSPNTPLESRDAVAQSTQWICDEVERKSGRGGSKGIGAAPA